LQGSMPSVAGSIYGHRMGARNDRDEPGST
jgi:hypothetical protein